MPQFRVIDLRSQIVEPEHIVDARSPEDAARQILGEKGVRGGQNRARLLCRVYWIDSEGTTNMVRLYRPLWDASSESGGQRSTASG